MDVATEVGIRELENGLSRYIGRARVGEEVIVTDRGCPAARLVPLDSSAVRLVELVEAGIVHPPTSRDVTDGLVDSAAAHAEEEALRAYDAVHPAGALAVGVDVCFSADGAFCAAADRRGFHVANPLAA